MDLTRLLESKVYIDTFAGAGGSTLGLRDAGWHGLFAVEKDPMAFETLQMNFLGDEAPYPHFQDWPEWLPKKHLTIEELLSNPVLRERLVDLQGQVTLIAGGPPCQGFSVGGARNGNDPRNEMIFQLIELISIVRPPFVLIENVIGITRPFSSRPGKTQDSVANIAINDLINLGYEAGYFRVDSSDYGVPQVRERVIIAAISKDVAANINVPNLFQSILSEVALEQLTEFGLPLDRPVNVKEALHDLAGQDFVPCPDSPKFQSSNYLPAESKFARLMRKNIATGSVPNSHRFSQHGPQVLGLYIQAHATQKPGRLSKQFLLASGTKTNKKFLLDPTKPSSTLTTHPDEHIHYLFPRNVSLREMARLQSFPDDFHFYGRYTLNGDRRGLDVSRCAQIGNAIPPFLGRALGLALNQIADLIICGQLAGFENIEEIPLQLTLF